MANVTYPGVYMQEVSSGVRPIQTAGTSTAAFIGMAEKGELEGAQKIYNFTQYRNLFGGFTNYSYLTHAVYQFFNNGGGQCYVVRVAGDGATAASLTLKDRSADVAARRPALNIEAMSPGAWGNQLGLVISDGVNDAANEFNLALFQEGVEAPLEIFENLSMNPAASNYVENKLFASQFIRVRAVENTNAAAGYSRSARPVPTAFDAGARNILRLDVDSDGAREVEVGGSTPADIAASIQNAVQALLPARTRTNPAAFSAFTAVIDGDGRLVLTSGSSHAGSAVVVNTAADVAADISGMLKLGTHRGGVEINGAAVLRPVANVSGGGAVAPQYHYHIGDHVPGDAVDAVTPGDDGAKSVSEQKYVDALHRLDDKDDVSLIAVPGIGSELVAGAGLAYCSNRPLQDCFFIADMREQDDTVEEAQAFMASISPKNSYGAVYTPWVSAPDPLGVSPAPVSVPPSGFVAGLYAQTDARRGVWKAPAGTSAGLAGASGLVKVFTDPEQGNLNPKNINVIRSFPGSGIVVWGARSIASDPEFGYIPVRRTAIMLRKSIYSGIQWAVFEPNDADLWGQLRMNITSFMMGLYRQGAFQGAAPSEAFFVKCDGETTTQGDIDRGVVNVQVGFAPLKPAEFIVVQISQKAGQS